MNEKLKTQEILKELELLDFVTRLAKATGKLEAVRVERLNAENKWQCVAGYNMKSTRIRPLGSIIHATLISNRKLIAIINTEFGERWVYADQIKNGWVTINSIEKDHSIPNTDFVVPETGY
ncbi:hypothetical protein M3914_003160 [Vibrio metschnikovii]|nr:hypothetical protein [Vibrio metschnikovii]